MDTGMTFTIGFPEVLSFIVAFVGAGWTLISMSFKQFEKRQEEKFKVLDVLASELKRLEIEIAKNDAKSAQIYSTKTEHDKFFERILNTLGRIEASLSDKVSREEVRQLLEVLHR